MGRTMIYFFHVCYMSDVKEGYIVNKYLLGHSPSQTWRNKPTTSFSQKKRWHMHGLFHTARYLAEGMGRRQRGKSGK